MVQICERCRRTNPREANYCHYDGYGLDNKGAAAIDVGMLPFDAPFLFAPGQSCRNFNELARACQRDGKTAFELLRTGYLEPFLAAQGRTDLAAAARAAARAADREFALDDFLGQLPGTGLLPARLRVASTVIELGTLRLGEDRRLEITLQNDGMRLMHGAASCDADWLALGVGSAKQNKLFRCATQTVLSVRVLGRQLRASEKPLEAVIQVRSNGGKIAILVRASIAVQPFPVGMLAGSRRPAEAARKAQPAPKKAAPETLGAIKPPVVKLSKETSRTNTANGG